MTKLTHLLIIGSLFSLFYGDRARFPLKFRPKVLITASIVVADTKVTKTLPKTTAAFFFFPAHFHYHLTPSCGICTPIIPPVLPRQTCLQVLCCYRRAANMRFKPHYRMRERGIFQRDKNFLIQ